MFGLELGLGKGEPRKVMWEGGGGGGGSMQKHRYNNAWLGTVLQISALCITQYVPTNKEIVRTCSNKRGEEFSSTHLLTYPIF